MGNIIKMLFAGMMFMFFVKFNWGRNLLIKVKENDRRVHTHTHTLTHTHTHTH